MAERLGDFTGRCWTSQGYRKRSLIARPPRHHHVPWPPRWAIGASAHVYVQKPLDLVQHLTCSQSRSLSLAPNSKLIPHMGYPRSLGNDGPAFVELIRGGVIGR